MAERVLTLRELNRATLSRQLLLERAALPVPAAVEQLVGLQAQLAAPPYIGLWTRLQAFQRADLARLIENRTIIKATLMRATLHLFTAADYLRFRATLQPMLDKAHEDIIKRRPGDLDMAEVLTIAQRELAEKPRTFAELTAHFSELMPTVDPGAIRYTIRTQLPLIQVPISTGWSYPGKPAFTLAESWLGQSATDENHLHEFVRRYLAAFGPATITDLQKWCGLGALKAVIEPLRPELITYRDETGRELFDLPDMPLPAADTPAPLRFLPEFDNLLLAHDKRTRVIADEHRSSVYLPGLRVSATILIDGFVAGTWKIEAKKKSAKLLIQPFSELTRSQKLELNEEGEKLLHFVAPDISSREISIGG